MTKYYKLNLSLQNRLMGLLFVSFLFLSSFYDLFAQCVDVSVTGTASSSNCSYGVEDVVWVKASSSVRNTITGNSLTKASSANSWDGNGFSYQSVSNGGYVQTTANETTTYRMVGLSATDVNSNWNTIQYAIYLQVGGVFDIRQSGNTFPGGTYATNDIFKIAVESNVVKYYKNGVLIYTSLVAPTLPLFVDVSTYTIGATVSSVKVANYNSGTYTVTGTNLGVSPSYQWKLNGGNVGTNSATYTNSGLAINDVINCVVTPGVGGCTPVVPANATSNSVTILSATSSALITDAPGGTSCADALVDAVWTNVTNNTVAGNLVTKTSSNNNWDGNAFSVQSVVNGGYIQTTVLETTTERMIGLSATDVNSSYTSIQYAFYLNVGLGLYVFESNANRGLVSTYTTNDVLKIAYDNNVIKYYKNGILVYTSAVVPATTLYADVSTKQIGATISDVKISNLNSGNFTIAGTNLGISPSYQWKLNGGNVGSNSASYSNSGLVNTDVVTCEVTTSCGTLVNANSVTLKSSTSNAIISVTPGVTVCSEALVDVNWAVISNNTFSGNVLTKNVNNGIWDGNAFSVQSISNEGYMQTTAAETTTNRMIGLSATDVNSNWNTIQYAIYLQPGGLFDIRQSGATIAGGSYATNDVFKIAVESNVVKYYKNGTLIYRSLVAPTLPLFVDVSTFSVGATLGAVKVSNLNSGIFTVSGTNIGATPSYQWKLNGGNVGTNSSSYTNSGLVNNDIVTCTISACGTSVTSNSVSIKSNIGAITIADAVAATSCIGASVDPVWTNTSNNLVSGSSVTKNASNGSWDGNAFSVQSISNGGYMQTTVAETNTQRMIGLSSSDVNSNWTSIQYAFYLNSNATLDVRQSGATISLGAFGTYATNDILKIAVENNIVNYYKNGVLVYSSAVTPTLPLYVDASTNTLGATLGTVKIVNLSSGNYTVTGVNIGITPSYQWKVNGGNVGTNSASYSNTGLVNNDIVTCTVSACGSSATSNNITLKSLSTSSISIASSSAVSSCSNTLTNVVWVNSSTAITNTISGNSLTKNKSNGNWDGNGFSYQPVYNNGFMQTTVVETNTARMVGLSATDGNSNWNTIQYAFYLQNGGGLDIRQSGVTISLIPSFATYAANDVLKIAVEENVVNYYKNGLLVYSSLITPTLPLYVDVSTNTVGATISNVKISNLNSGTFTATALGANIGSSPVYQWKLNGGNVGTNSSTYTNASLATNDVVTCELTACGSTVVSNSSTVNALAASAVYVTATPGSTSCTEALADVVWRNVNYNTPVANSLTKSSGGALWNGNAFSYQSVSNGGYMQTTVVETNTARMIGLSSLDANGDWTSIQYAFYLQTGGLLDIRQSGATISLGVNGIYAANDILKIAVESNVVKYYKNGSLVYTSAVVPTLPLYVDVSTNTIGATLSAVKIANGSSTTFTVGGINLGTSPSYQWKLNGGNVGSNSTTYTDNGLLINDVVTCVVTACGSPITSNNVTIKALPASTIYVTATPASLACTDALVDVVWKNVYNNTVSGNSLTKNASNGNWDGNAFSVQSISNNGYVQTVVQEITTNRMIGLSATDGNSNWPTIQYAFFLQPGGLFDIRQSGATISGGSYATNDVFKIAVESNVVNYYKNGSLVYTSLVAPTLPLYVDVSTNSIGATISNVKVSNGSSSIFTATATNIGVAPVYQWKLNGANVGTNSTTYTNASLILNDVVTCELTVCSAVYVSNSTTINAYPTSSVYITGTPAALACTDALVNVAWKNVANNSISSNSLTKNASNGNWDGGAFSFQSISNNGYMQTVAQEITTERMIGLSSTDANSSYTSIQYAFYLQPAGVLGIYESNVSRGNISNYATNDVLKISIESNVVKYYKNGSLIYTSAVVPTLPLYVDVSTRQIGATVSNVKISNGSSTTYTAVATNAGVSPVYQWKLNGANVGSNSTTYTNPGLVLNDLVTCELTVCSATYISNSAAITTLPASTIYISGTAAPLACTDALVNVSWKNVSNNAIATNSLTKNASGGNWDGGAFSFQSVTNNGYMTTVAQETTTERMIGLSSTDANSSFTSIQYAFYLQPAGVLGIYESNVSRGTFGTYVANDVLKIANEGNVIKYYKNNVLVYTSAVVPAATLYVDVSTKQIGATVSNVKISNGSSSIFTATATNATVSPVYQWKLNGVNVGTNSTSYTNASLVLNDVVTCELTVCGVLYPSNNISISTYPASTIYISATPVVTTCTDALVNVVWRNVSNNNTVATNSVTKNANNLVWDGNAFSAQSVVNNGYMQTVAQETTTNRMIGLSATDANSSYTNIQYAFYLQSGGLLGIYESSVSRGNFGNYSTNDVLKIANESNVIKYYKNGSLVYTSATVPAATLYVDVSTYNIGATLSNVKISNGSSTTFTATATNVAVSPVYQWKLNGANVGSNSTTYTNVGLVVNDIVTCELTVCGATYVSNTATINGLTASTIYITGTRTTACTEAVEDVVWRNVGNNAVATNSLTKNASGGAWDGNAFSYQTVVNNGYVQTTVQETTTSRMIGLSSTDANSSYTSIQYALFLQPAGVLGIYESGANRGNFGTYAANDILKIANESNVIKYYKNGTLVYTSLVVPAATLYVDVSTNTIGSTLSNVKVSNGNLGVFTATGTNLGASPTYQWKVNGVNVGTNSATYNYTGFINSDVITCALTVCGNTVTSNNINVKIATTNWLGGTNAWGTGTNWDNGVPTACISANILSGANDPVITSAALVNSLNIGTGRTLTISGSNTLDVYGNWTNQGAFTTGSSTINMVGATPQIISKTGGETFNNLTFNSSSIKTLNNSVSVAGTLTLTNGIVQPNTVSDTLKITSTNAISGGSTTSHVNGILSQKITATGNKIYPVGDGTYYLPVTLNYPTVSSAGVVAVSVTNGDHPSIGTNACLNANQSVNKYWTINKVGSATLPAPQSFSSTFTYPTLPNAGVADAAASSGYSTFLYDGANWSSVVTTSSTNTATVGNPISFYGSYQLAVGTSTLSGWSGAVDTDWFNANNWTCGGVPNSIKDASIPSGLIRYPIINATATTKSITIVNGATVTVSGSNIFNVYGDWANSGTFVPNTGTVVMTGATASAISGGDTTFFNNLKIDKTSAATVTVSSPVVLQDKLSFGTTAVNTLAVDNVGGGSFVFKSDATTTAHIDVVTDPTKAVFSGSFVCQKYLAGQGGRYNFMLGLPVTNGFMNTLQPTTFDVSGYGTNGFLITGPFTGTNTGTGLATYVNSSFEYNPTTGLYTGYPVVSGDIATTPLVAGHGYRFAVRDNATNTATVAKTLTVTGLLAPAGPFTFSGLVNGVGTKPFSSNALPPSSSTGGWNLVSNPYMSDISIDLSDATNWTKSNISNTAYVYNAATKDFSSCASGVPSGGNCQVSAFQGFFVRATGAPSLVINESAKISTSNTNTLNRIAQADVLNYLGIKLSSSASINVNSTYIRYKDGANTGNDQFDGLKLGATQRTYISDLGVYSKGKDGVFYDVNAKPYDFVSDTTELLVKLPAGNAKLNFSDIANLELGYQISLYDKFTKTLTDVNVNPDYNFTVTADSNTSGPRFQVIFNRSSVITGVNDLTNDNSTSVVIYPSPTSANNFNVGAYGLTDGADLFIYDLTGRLVFSSKLKVTDGKIRQYFDLTGILASGMYNTLVKSGDSTFKQKVIIK